MTPIHDLINCRHIVDIVYNELGLTDFELLLEMAHEKHVLRACDSLTISTLERTPFHLIPDIMSDRLRKKVLKRLEEMIACQCILDVVPPPVDNDIIYVGRCCPVFPRKINDGLHFPMAGHKPAGYVTGITIFYGARCRTC